MLADTALRMALRSMLNDLTYPERRKSREHTEDQLRQDHWSAGHPNILMRRALGGPRPEPRRGSRLTQGVRRGDDSTDTGRPRGQGHRPGTASAPQHNYHRDLTG